jgi:hypothetical protein
MVSLKLGTNIKLPETCSSPNTLHVSFFSDTGLCSGISKTGKEYGDNLIVRQRSSNAVLRDISKITGFTEILEDILCCQFHFDGAWNFRSRPAEGWLMPELKEDMRSLISQQDGDTSEIYKEVPR